jgi:flavoprotein
MKCEHFNLEPVMVEVDDILHPMRCEDCRAVVECPHHEIDKAEDFNDYTCVDCLATDVIEPIEYDKYAEDK